MADDFEKNRSEYVVTLETKVQHLQRQLQELQEQARWIPAVNTTMSSAENAVRTTLSFGGQRVTTTVSYDSLAGSSVNDITGAVLDSLWKNLISDRFREIIEPEIARAKDGVKAIAGAGKW